MHMIRAWGTEEEKGRARAREREREKERERERETEREGEREHGLCDRGVFFIVSSCCKDEKLECRMQQLAVCGAYEDDTYIRVHIQTIHTCELEGLA